MYILPSSIPYNDCKVKVEEGGGENKDNLPLFSVVSNVEELAESSTRAILFTNWKKWYSIDVLYIL